MAAASIDEKFQQEWTAPGTYSFKVPPNTTRISAVCISGGQGGQDRLNGQAPDDGGFGGSLRYSSEIVVTPGETLTVVVGVAGVGGLIGVQNTLGGSTYIMRGSTVLLSAACATGTVTSTPVNSVGSSTIGGHNGGVGTPQRTGGFPGAGGGAGGYSGGGNTVTGGAGGQGFPINGNPGLGSGGGVGIRGEGLSGANGTSTSPQGKGGSLGSDGASSGVGGLYGGGGAGGQNGGSGACRIIGGANRSYPSTNTQDV